MYAIYALRMSAIPKSIDEVTTSWLQQQLQPAFEDFSVLNVDHCKEQHGLLSTVALATIKTKTGETKPVFIKIMPNSFVHKTIIGNNFMDLTEVEFYRSLVPKLERFQQEKNVQVLDLNIMAPKFYAGDVSMENEDRRFFLILENISSTHKMLDLNQGLTANQIKSCLQEIAKFHGLTLAYAHFNGPWSKAGDTNYLSDFVDSFRTNEQHQGFMDMNFQNLHRDMKAEEGFAEAAAALGKIRKKV